MAVALDSIVNGFTAYAKNWRSLCGPFLHVIGLQMLCLVATIGLDILLLSGASPSNFSQRYGVVLVAEFSLGLLLLYGMVLLFASAYKPMDDALAGSPISKWRENVRPQMRNASQLLLFRLLCIAGAVALFIAAFIPAMFLGVTIGGLASLFTIMACLAIAGGLSLVGLALTEFVEMEVLLGRKGLMDAISSSSRIVLANPLELLLFLLIWLSFLFVSYIAMMVLIYALEIVGLFIMMPLLFFGGPVGILLGMGLYVLVMLLAALIVMSVYYLIATPLLLLSLIGLWRSLAEKEGIVRDGWSRR